MTNPLCQPLESHQQILIEEVWKLFQEHGRWPVLGYIDHVPYNRYSLDIQEVIGTLPSLSGPASTIRYGLVIAPQQSSQAEVEVRLTFAGMYHVEAADPFRRGFLGEAAELMARMTLPGASKPPRNQVLETIRDFLLQADLLPTTHGRIQGAFDVLCKLRQIRNAGQHADAQHKVVKRVKELNLAWPPQDWAQIWAQIAGLARGNLDILREEIQANESAFISLVADERE